MERDELASDEAIAVVAASARHLFPTVSEQQARQLATLVLRDLAARGIRLVRDQAAARRRS